MLALKAMWDVMQQKDNAREFNLVKNASATWFLKTIVRLKESIPDWDDAKGGAFYPRHAKNLGTDKAYVNTGCLTSLRTFPHATTEVNKYLLLSQSFDFLLQL